MQPCFFISTSKPKQHNCGFAVFGYLNVDVSKTPACLQALLVVYLDIVVNKKHKRA